MQELKKTVYYLNGQILFEEPWVYRGLFGRGQEIVHEYEEYLVQNCEIRDGAVHVYLKSKPTWAK